MLLAGSHPPFPHRFLTTRELYKTVKQAYYINTLHGHTEWSGVDTPQSARHIK